MNHQCSAEGLPRGLAQLWGGGRTQKSAFEGEIFQTSTGETEFPNTERRTIKKKKTELTWVCAEPTVESLSQWRDH